MIRPRRHRTISIGGDVVVGAVALIAVGIVCGAVGGWLLARRFQ